MSVLDVINELDAAPEESLSALPSYDRLRLADELKSARVDALDALRGHPAWPVTARETRLADFIINLFSIQEHEIR